MNIFRFVLSAYPTDTHPEYHSWQRASVIIFISENDPKNAEHKAIELTKDNLWVPESFKIRDVLVRDRVEKEGGHVWDAYQKAEEEGFFFTMDLEVPAFTHKNDQVWGTGPGLNEEFIDTLITESSGHRLTEEEAANFENKNADYVLGDFVLELKQFEQEGLSVSTRQAKIAELFRPYMDNAPVQIIDPFALTAEDFQKYWEIMGVPVQKRIRKASKQVKQTLSWLNDREREGGIILLNTGYLTVPHDFLVAMAERYAAKDSSSIKHVIVISSWTLTNGFDSNIYYAFHPHNPESPELIRLKDAFWARVNQIMSNLVTGKQDHQLAQTPMGPLSFVHEGKTFTFGIPKIESSLSPNK